MKRGLVLSGGGSKGAYESGAISYILGEKGVHYDVICGVSVGALNGAYLCMFEQGKERVAAEFLKEIWFSIDDSKIWKSWFPLIGKLFALWKRSIYSTKPLRQMVHSTLDVDKIKKSGKHLCIGAVSLRTGAYRLFDETYEDIHGAVLASSAFPCAFEPVKLNGQYWSDGGLREVTPLRAAIDLGCDEIDVIVTGPEYINPVFGDNPNIIDIGLRSLDILTDQIMVDDITKTTLYNKLVESGVISNKKKIPLRIIRPASVLNKNPLSFKPKEIQLLHRHGFEDAQRIFESGVTQ